ncbi:MAG: malate synthase [Solirubrobacteraceae bacterium]|nr:malate synthase [Solirubrobacteraceae bacterium]
MDLFDNSANRLLNRLHDELDAERRRLLDARQEVRARLRAGGTLDFLAPSEATTGDWRITPVPPALEDRRVEITGPTSPKMVINALNSGARCFMADFEDSNSPTWHNMTDGQLNLQQAIRGTLTHSENGKDYELVDDPALLLARVRGLHLPERHLDSGVCGAFMDFALYVRHNHEALADRGWGPYFYVPKLESHLEARLWNRAFEIAEEELGLERGTIRATVLIETVPAAFEMEEILYELREHAAGLNAGRWDYLFSMIKNFSEAPEFVLPDRNAVTMTVPFMHAYTEQLVAVCHRRGAHAMGGMSAVIPSRTDEEANQRALEAVSSDKQREAEAGYDGTWVAHPDSVEVAMKEFDAVLGDRPNQLDRLRDDVSVTNKDLLAVGETPGEATMEGLANDVNVGIQYISSWLRGNGAAGIYGLMEDAATAEIARGQVWQWIRHSVMLDTGRPVTPELVRQTCEQQLARIREEIGDDAWFEREGRPALSRELFEQVALSEDFAEFLTLPAYEKLLELEG